MNYLKNFSLVLRLSLIFIRLIIKIGQFLKIRCYFGQTGEDVILKNLFVNKKDPVFYLDIGCNHPISLSNTFSFYLQGGRGICVDANPDLINIFKKVRRKDVAINALISDIEEELFFYSLDNHAMSTADPEQIKKIGRKVEVKKTKVKSLRLDHLLEKYLPEKKQIDLMSIDVEGFDFKVLSSIDLNRYRPSVILVEMHGRDISDSSFLNDEIVNYLKRHGYSLKYYATMNGYFVHEDFAKSYKY